MNANIRNAWWRIVLALASACLLTIVVCVILARLSSAAASDFPNWDRGESHRMLLDDTDAYTIYLPLISWMCPYQSTRPPLQGTANFPGEAEIQTPKSCTTGLPTETPIWFTGTYTGTPANVILWVLACSPEQLYYPQSPAACTGEPPEQVGGHWQVPVYLGKKGGAPEWFDVVVILTDGATSQFLGNWVKKGCQDGEYKGMSASLLNQMAIAEKDYVVVQTTD